MSNTSNVKFRYAVSLNFIQARLVPCDDVDDVEDAVEVEQIHVTTFMTLFYVFAKNAKEAHEMAEKFCQQHPYSGTHSCGINVLSVNNPTYSTAEELIAASREGILNTNLG